MGIDLGWCLEERDARRLSDYLKDKSWARVIGQFLASQQGGLLSSGVPPGDGVTTDLVFLGLIRPVWVKMCLCNSGGVGGTGVQSVHW